MMKLAGDRFCNSFGSLCFLTERFRGFRFRSKQRLGVTTSLQGRPGGSSKSVRLRFVEPSVSDDDSHTSKRFCERRHQPTPPLRSLTGLKAGQLSIFLFSKEDVFVDGSSADSPLKLFRERLRWEYLFEGNHRDYFVEHFRHFWCAASPTTAGMSDTVGVSSGPRVLSIQSHVVHGFVGNKCSVFVLQRLGLDVDPINTVHLSNHKKYPVCKGGVLQGNDIEDLFSGLEANELLDYSHVLTGYVGSPSVLVAIAKMVEKMKKSNAGLTFVCDPVIGDNGRLYVPEELVGVYKDSIVGLCDVLTPNQLELELLAAEKVHTQEDVFRVCENLHAKGPHTIVVTSVDLWDSDPDAPITVMASTKRSQADGHPCKMKFQVKRIPGYFGGTGDVFTSLLLAWMSKDPERLDVAVGKTLGSVGEVLQATCDYGEGAFSNNASDARSCSGRELRLVQAQDSLVNPVETVKAIPMD